MSTQTKYEQDIIRLNDWKDYPLWYIQIRKYNVMKSRDGSNQIETISDH